MSLEGIQNVSMNAAENILKEPAGVRKADTASLASDKVVKDNKAKSAASQKSDFSRQGIKQTDEEDLKERIENQKKYDDVMTEKAVENANNRIKASHTNAKFEFNEKINRVTITITDATNDEIIREIPPEATQKMLERIHTFSGILMDTEV
ncbi:MAG: flagellar protein FlaG [Clostridia bacterium]|nr:flagellar protein FlaG [Clostridia bacterium]